MKKVFLLSCVFFLISYSVLYSQTVITIDSARNSVNDTVTVEGVVISPNYQTTSRSYYIWDGTNGIVTYKGGLTSPALKLGDSVSVTGVITPFHGLLQINLLTDTSLVILDSNAIVPSPEVISLSEYVTNPEKYEAHLIEIKGLSLASGTWPTSNSNASLYLTDGTDTVNVFLDKDEQLFNYSAPKWPVDLIGIGSQYGTDTTGYEILPRYITDFISKIVPIDWARTMLNDTVTVEGVVISPNYQTTSRSYYIWDGTGGLATYRSGLTSADLKLGDSVRVTGKITEYYGLTEISSFNDTDIVKLDSDAVLPAPEVITISDFLGNPETYESHLIEFKALSLASGTWSTSGSSTLDLTDGTDTVVVYLDKDEQLFNYPEPTWPVDLICIGTQYSGGYEVLPRYISDFVEVPVVPVELESFSANINKGMVVLSWKTATETNNSGFEVERSIDSKTFVKVGFVGGHGTTTKINTYTFTDKLQNAGEYYYRLKQIDYNGTYKYSDIVKTTSVVPKSFSLSQNYPNPFNPSTVISYDLPVASKVVLKVYDILGNEVATLINKEEEAGSYQITFNTQGASNHKQLSSGVYIYRIEAGKFTAIKKMMLLK